MVDRIDNGRVPTYSAYGGVPEAEAYGNVSNLAEGEKDNTYQILEENRYEIYPKLSALFDGNRLTIHNYDRLEGDIGGRSGNVDYQYKNAMSIPNLGPIPEGNWLLKYSDFETNKDPFSDYHNHWGRERVKITPVDVPNTYGRGNFYVHGSYNGLGSAGCIDLGVGMPTFGGIMKKYQQDIPLTVKYSDDFGKK